MDAPADSSAAAKAKAFLRSWRKVFYAYANSSLTYASDKMVALAGVAEEFQEISDYTYLAGLWKEWFLADQLLWLAAPNKRRANAHPVGPSVYKAPSWSWMSFNGRVSASTATYPSLIEFLDAYTTLVDDKNSTGQVKGGLIRVRGQLEWVHLRKAHQSKETYSIYGVDDDQMGLVRVRFDEPSWRHNDVHCMPVRVCWGDTLEGLLLESTGQAHLEFRRVGHFQSIDKMPLEKLGRVVPEDKVVFTIV
ncbi:MAG: hypothetical protein L6R41_001458 [Letrouitia leprolyta]|nr:MAG: hypothetical protein L6R41_001458 [Letrouitia leprolyta]